MANKLEQQYPQFFELNGTALNDGYIYIGVNGLNPETNPIPIFLDEDLTTPISQPLRTSGGYIYYNGSPVSIYFNESTYSITVKNSLSNLIYTILSNNAFSYPKVIDTIEDLATYTGTGTGLVMVKDINRGGTFASKILIEIDPNTGNLYEVNNVTVFAKLGGGFWAREYTGAVYIRWSEAKGDGITDDTIAVISAVNAANGLLIWEYNKTYLLTNKIPIIKPIAINLNKSIINFNLTTTNPGFDVQSDNVTIENGNVTVNGTVMGGYGGSLSCIFAGNPATGVGFKNLTFRNLTVTTNRNDAGASIGIMGECSNVLIENITVPDNANCRNVIGCEWGGTPGGGTGHPHNIIIRNIKIGKLTYPTYGSSGYGYAVWLSACFNVLVENVTMEQGYGLVMAIRGDNANTYAPLKYKYLVGTNIKAKNLSISSYYGYAIRAIGSMGSLTLDNIPMNVTFENVKAIGGKIGANNNFAFSIEQSDGVSLSDFEFSGSYTAAISTGINNFSPVVKNGKISNAELYTIALGNNCISPVIENISFSKNNSLGGTGTGTASIFIQDCKDALINNCKFGIEGEVETQKYNIYASSLARRPTITNNHTHSIATGGVSYLFGASSNTEIEPKGSNNTSASGITNQGGCPIFVIHPDGDKSFYNANIPTVGTYNQGDKVYFPSPVASGFIGAVCTVAGTPGTWKTFGAITA